MSFLTLTGIQKTYGANAVVRDFDLSVERGELVTFLGPSGCGKTTTLRMIAGFETPTEGSIRIDGRDVTNLRANRRAIGMVFQAYALFPNMTVAQNIGFGLKVAGKPAAAIKARVGEMLAMIKLPQLAERYPYQLSGGQQQRVSLARALAAEPADSAARRTAVRPRRPHPRVAYARKSVRFSAIWASPRFSSLTTRKKRCRCRIASS